MIKLERTTKEFKSRNGHPIFALKDVDLEIRSGEFVMVVGPSGSGKSTLLFTVGGMQQPSEGSVFLGGTDIYRLSPAKRAKLRRTRIGFVFQTFNLIPYLDCLDNVVVPAVLDGVPRRTAIDRAHDLLERLGLALRLKHRPSELSVGERQRVALCRSLINEPEVLLADEPTGNLDSVMTDEAMRILRELHVGGQTIVMATHDVNLAEKGTRVIALREGLVEEDRPSQDGGGQTGEAQDGGVQVGEVQDDGARDDRVHAGEARDRERQE